MNNYLLHKRAQELSDTKSAYQLARNVVTMQARLAVCLEARAGDIQQAVMSARKDWAAQADPDYLLERDAATLRNYAKSLHPDHLCRGGLLAKAEQLEKEATR